MRTRQKHPGLSLRQWRFFLFRLLAGHWVDSADYLREAQVRRQAEYTQRNLSSHPSEKKNPSQRWFRKPAINRREVCTTLRLFIYCYQSKFQHFVSFSEACSGCRCPGADPGQAARWSQKGGVGSPYARRGLLHTTQHRAQLSPQLSFSHRESLGKEGRTQLRAKDEGKNVTNRRGNTHQNRWRRKCSIWCPSTGFTPGCRRPTCVEGKSVKGKKFQGKLCADCTLCKNPCRLLRVECREFGS